MAPASGERQAPAACAPVTRREFVTRAGAAMGALAAGAPSLEHLGQHSRSRLERIGLQVYTVRKVMERELERTFARIAEIGYREVELWNNFGRSPRQMRAILDANGLTAPSAHNADVGAIRTRWAQTLEDSVVLGHRYVVCASLPAADRSAEGLRRVAELFNTAGAQARAAGLTLAYHNHSFEFGAVQDGTSGYDLLLAECDPALVAMQADLFWMVKAGVDPLEYFAKHPGRFFSVHVKDMDAAGNMTEVGTGRLPFARFFAQSEQAGIRHYYVEHDDPADPMASIGASFRHLSQLRF